MKNTFATHWLTLTTEDDKKSLIEQYKALLDSINKSNDIRETTNNFWISINSALIAMIAYIRDSENVGGEKKLLFLFTVILLGCTLTGFWWSSLLSIKKAIDLKNQIVVEIEKYLPARAFTLTIKEVTGEPEHWGALSVKEMFVPFLFLISYGVFSIFLYLFPKTVLPS